MSVEVGKTVETSSGWLLEIKKIDWWSDDDGQVHGHSFNGKEWSAYKYLGTVKGIREMAVSRLRIV